MNPPASQVAPRVCAVVVTYGDRSTFLRKTLEALTHLDGPYLTCICVVQNGAHAPTRRYLQSAAAAEPRVRLLDNGGNLGSAGGFRTGIRYAYEQSGCDFIWLLDDDNEPARDALRRLVDAQERMARTHARPTAALCSFRRDRDVHVHLAKGLPPEEVFPLRSSFMTFHVRSFLRRRLRSWRAPANAPDPSVEVELPWAPYGGLFLARSTVERIGYPDARLFTYADDTEYTHRIVASGGAIVLVVASVVRDVDASWTAGIEDDWLPLRLLRADSDFRVFYTVRNHVHFSYHRWRHRGLVYRVNRTLFLWVLWILARRRRRMDRYRLIRCAIDRGERADFAVPAGVVPPQ